MVFCFVQNIFFSDKRLRILHFFPEFNTRFYDKKVFFSSAKIWIFFSVTLGIRIFFFGKKHNPSPLQVKWLFPYNVPRTAIYNCIYLINLYNKKQTKLWDTIATNIGHELFYFANTVKPAHTVISIKQSPMLRGHILLSCYRKCHMNWTSFKTTFSLTQMWPPNTGFNAQWKLSKSNLLVTKICVLNKQMFGFYRLNWQIFLTHGFYLYEIPFFSGCEVRFR
jgi:hypothetical protein